MLTLSTEGIWLLVILYISKGIDVCEALDDCTLPSNLKDSLTLNPVILANSTYKRYLASCLDGGKKLYPLGDLSDVQCMNNTWTSRNQLPFLSFQIGDNSSARTSFTFSVSDLECLRMCAQPKIPNGNFILDEDYLMQTLGKRIMMKVGGDSYYRPGTVFVLVCDEGYRLSSPKPKSTCDDNGEWIPPISSCIDQDITTKLVEAGASVDPKTTTIIATSISVVAFLLCAAIMVVIAIRAKWRVVCRKRRGAPTSHPDDINYPHGYTQLGSGSLLPSYAEALDCEDEDFRPNHHFSGVYRPTTTTDYRQLSSLESSSREESLSMSAASQSHRHSLFSGSSANYRAAGGDDISDILVQAGERGSRGDHLSMSDTSTLVTVNTYESQHTASNPSLTNSRRGIAGSMTSNGLTSLDDAPLIVRDADDAGDDPINRTVG